MFSQTGRRFIRVNPKLRYAILVLIALIVITINSDAVTSSTLYTLIPGDIVVSGRSGIHVIPSGTGTPLNLLGGPMHGVAVDTDGLVIAVADDIGIIELDPATGIISTLAPRGVKKLIQ